MKKWGLHKYVSVISIFVFVITFLLLQYSLLNNLHSGSDAPLISAIFVVLALAVSIVFKLKITILTATIGYLIAFILGLVFNTTSIDPIHGNINNFWMIWLVSCWLFIGIGMLIDIYVRMGKKKRK